MYKKQSNLTTAFFISKFMWNEYPHSGLGRKNSQSGQADTGRIAYTTQNTREKSFKPAKC